MTADLRIVSLCSGMGGLDLAVMDVLGGRLVAHAETDAAASRVLAHHWPDVPNLGDITEIDWVPWAGAVDVLTAGFPCTDLSTAGRRAGLGAGTRSGIWAHVARAVEEIRPALVVIENVEALLSTAAQRSTDARPARVDSGVALRPADVGDPTGGPPLTAAGAVLGDLADCGYDASWCTVPASGVGACHRRKRVFIIAWPAAAGDSGGPHGLSLLPTPRTTDVRGAGDHGQGGPDLRTAVALLPTAAAADADRTSTTYARGNPTLIGALLPTPAARDAERGAGYGSAPGRPLSEAIVDLLPTPRATDGTKGGPNQRGSSGDLMLPSAVAMLPTPRATRGGSSTETVALLPTPRVSGVRTSRGAATGTSSSSPSLEQAMEIAAGELPRELNSWGEAPASWQQANHENVCAGWNDDELLPDGALFPLPWTPEPAGLYGKYTAAITRHEVALGRPAPPLTIVGARGGKKLNPAFVEWMMMLPAGHVTAVPGVTVNEMLVILGNGVIPPQAAAALRFLITVE